MAPQSEYASIAQIDNRLEVEDKSSTFDKRSENFLPRFHFLILCSHIFIFIAYSSIFYFKFSQLIKCVLGDYQHGVRKISNAICFF